MKKLPKITLKWMRDRDACWPDKELNTKFFNKQKAYTPQEFMAACCDKKVPISDHLSWLIAKVIRQINRDYKETSTTLESLGGHAHYTKDIFSDSETLHGYYGYRPIDRELSYMYAILCLDMLEAELK